jgi:hypothetical protein
MTREEYFRFSLGRDPYGASEKPRPTGPVVIQGLSGPVEVGNPFNPMHLIRGVGDMFMGALQDMGNIGHASYHHSPPTKQQPSLIGDSIDTAKAIKDDPVGVGKALVDSMMPYSEGGFVNLGTAVAGPKVMPKVVSGVKTGAKAVGDTANYAKNVIDSMKPTRDGRGRKVSRREFNKSASAALPVLASKGPLTSNAPSKATGRMADLAGQKAQHQFYIKDALDNIKGEKEWTVEVAKRSKELNEKMEAMITDEIGSIHDNIRDVAAKAVHSDGKKHFPTPADAFRELGVSEGAIRKLAAGRAGDKQSFKDMDVELMNMLESGWEGQHDMRGFYEDLKYSSRDAAESGLFSKREIANEIHPQFEKSQKWMKAEDTRIKQLEARQARDFKKLEAELKKRPRRPQEADQNPLQHRVMSGPTRGRGRLPDSFYLPSHQQYPYNMDRGLKFLAPPFVGK